MSTTELIMILTGMFLFLWLFMGFALYVSVSLDPLYEQPKFFRVFLWPLGLMNEKVRNYMNG